MKTIDWQMVAFVGMTLLQDYWCYFRLPRVYYWHVTENNRNKAA